MASATYWSALLCAHACPEGAPCVNSFLCIFRNIVCRTKMSPSMAVDEDGGDVTALAHAVAVNRPSEMRVRSRSLGLAAVILVSHEAVSLLKDQLGHQSFPSAQIKRRVL
eukprot:339472-Amphidinium_carterae.2